MPAYYPTIEPQNKKKNTRKSEILTEPVTGPSAWTPAELAADDGWIYPLGAAEIAELEAAVEEVGEKG